MARSDTLRFELARLQVTEAALRKTVAGAEKDAAAARAVAAKKRVEAARTKSSATRSAALRAAATQDKKSATAEKKIADAKAKLASNAKTQATKQRGLMAAEKSDQKAADREADKRRTKEKNHARDVGRLTSPTVRYVAIRPPEPERLRVLYLTSNPEAVEREIVAPDGTVTREGTWLRTDAEVRGVQQMLARSKYRHLVDLSHRPAATPYDLLDAINDVRPHVIHFSGHGWSHGLLMDNGSVESPEGHELDFELLAKLLAATTTPPTLLVLNACETEQSSRPVDEDLFRRPSVEMSRRVVRRACR
jgi:hypothetical protein